MATFKSEFEYLLRSFSTAQSFAAQDEAMTALNSLRSEYESMMVLAQIRHTINTEDSFYKDEQDYSDQTEPVYLELVSGYYRALLGATHRKELEEKWGSQLFRIAELAQKTISPGVINDLQKENALASEYTKLIAAASINFAGEERNLEQLIPFQLSPHRLTRKEAHEARYGFLSSNEEELDRIYDELVRVRTTIARKLGFNNFVELAYMRLNRSDYNAAMVAGFRQQVLDFIVPLASSLKARQRTRIGVDTLHYYDNNFYFKTGNARPQGPPDWIVNQGARMYSELSPETGAFFTYMNEKGLMDLVSKKGKAAGGYCNYIAKHQAPFIFSNFNGTSGDVDVLTHEAGHAFQLYQSRHLTLPEYSFPTYEACEIHSMSMELFAWPWMELFFGPGAGKYKFFHLSDSLFYVAYEAAVDEFQHLVYNDHEATPAQRKKFWRETEKKYLPHLNYEDSDYLEKGGYWQQQSHIYKSPFYYIDYALAQICAFQFWKRYDECRNSAWSDYLKLCRAGGSLSFVELIKLSGLISPFEPGCVKAVAGQIAQWLDGFDDSGL
jgi:M3 family oligoendopeptidase